MVEDVSCAHAQRLPDRRRGGFLVVGDNGVVSAYFQFKAVKPVTRSAPDPIDFVGGGRGEAGVHAVRAQHTRPVVEIETDDIRLGTGELNRVIREAMTLHPPPMKGTRRLKVFYATQLEETAPRPFAPVKFLFFVNAPGLLTPTYETYLAAQLRRIGRPPRKAAAIRGRQP